jgi:hypothetical protein
MYIRQTKSIQICWSLYYMILPARWQTAEHAEQLPELPNWQHNYFPTRMVQNPHEYNPK